MDSAAMVSPQDAGQWLSKATTLLRGHYPDDHDLLLLCKHRLGMISAASRDARAATSLLQPTQEHYTKQDKDHPLAHEANFGLAMVQLVRDWGVRWGRGVGGKRLLAAPAPCDLCNQEDVDGVISLLVLCSLTLQIALQWEKVRVLSLASTSNQ